MSENKDAQYREEFESGKDNYKKAVKGTYKDTKTYYKWIGFLAGRKKGGEAKDQYVQALEEAGVSKTIKIESLKKELEVSEYRNKGHIDYGALKFEENKKLRQLVEQAVPWVMERKYARALDKKDYNEEVQWQNEVNELLK